MIKSLRYLVALLVLGAASVDSYAFEYRIVTNAPDSTLNGMYVQLRNRSDIVVPYSDDIKDCAIDIRGESERSFPALLHITSREGEKRKQYRINLIVEPGEIVVDINNKFPISGGPLNDGLKKFDNRLLETCHDPDRCDAIKRETIRQNVGNGLGEYALMYYCGHCSPSEWEEVIGWFDDETRSLTYFDDISGVKQRLAPVWDGQPFRDVEGQTLDGEPVRLSNYVGKGKYVLADVWASWCGPCIRMAQQILTPLYDEYKDNPDIQFVGLATNDVSKLEVAHKLPWPQIMNCKKLMGTYVARSFPELILFGPDGTIIKRHVDHPDVETLKKFLDEKLEKSRN